MDNKDLIAAIVHLEQSLSVASLGQHLFKVRVKRKGAGKSAGFRTIIVYKKGDIAILLYGFGKNKKSNITQLELLYFQKLGNDFLALNRQQMAQLTEQKALFDLTED